MPFELLKSEIKKAERVIYYNKKGDSDMKVKDILKKVKPMTNLTIVNYGIDEEKLDRQKVLDLQSKYLDKTVCSLCVEEGIINIYCK